MLYPKNNEEKLSLELFNSPTSEYRGAPFWAWNCKVDKTKIAKQVSYFKEMGLGGFHIHSRVGLDTEYLSDTFMELVKTAYNAAKENDMLCWLYDEDRWPSGSAGGYVTKNISYRARFLVFSPEEFIEEPVADAGNPSSGEAQRSRQRRLLGKYEVILKEGCLKKYRKLEEKDVPEKNAKLWWAYIEISGNSPWFNNQAYVNTLDPEAIKEFINMTHERYYEVLGTEFGKTIPAIFTDEPQFTHKECLGYADEEKNIILPFTDDLEETFKAAYGESLLEHLPELFWELPEPEVSVTRFRYHDHLSERFASAFADTVGNWCKEHNIMLTGHMMEEPTLFSQTRALGDAMRSYRSFQLPGIDMLCDWREFSTAKQAQSVSHQYGCPGVISELYGVTNWDFDFRGHKLQGDWQAALGVTVRVQHLAWMSMEGEAKRDYPASIGYQSPWYKEYPLIENHFSRLNTALTRGKAKVSVAVIHPVESYWLHWGPREQTSAKREELETNFKSIIDWLLFGLIDFDFISEALLPSISKIEETKSFKAGEMEYRAILVPACETLRLSTVERLEAFRKAGGKVIFAGEAPKYMDAKKSDRVIELAEGSERISFAKNSILKALRDYRDVEIKKEDGSAASNLFYQMREDGNNRWLFLCHVNKMDNPDIASIETINISIRGGWKPTVFDSMSGQCYPYKSKVLENQTIIEYQFSQHDSLLLYLEPSDKDASADHTLFKREEKSEGMILKGPVAVTLSEPNILLLDMAEYCFDGGGWQAKEEILRIDNLFRTKLGYPLRMEALAQPWVNRENAAPEHTISLRFTIISDIEVCNPCLALENPEVVEIIVNHVKVPSHTTGWYVDECIGKVQIPSLPKGQSEIILNIPFGSKTNVEWCYLLGDFGVKVEGSHARIAEPVRQLYFGDWTQQGLPFYGGNVTYHCDIVSEDCNCRVEVPQFRNPLLSVSLDGEEKGKIAFAPYISELGRVKSGKHKLEITAFGNRVNTFGAVHNCNHTVEWFGPNAWRTAGNSWAYEYQLKPAGILIGPRVGMIMRG
jgi:hypothetical protein